MIFSLLLFFSSFLLFFFSSSLLLFFSSSLLLFFSSSLLLFFSPSLLLFSISFHHQNQSILIFLSLSPPHPNTHRPISPQKSTKPKPPQAPPPTPPSPKTPQQSSQTHFLLTTGFNPTKKSSMKENLSISSPATQTKNSASVLWVGDPLGPPRTSLLVLLKPTCFNSKGVSRL